ncbi:hypothetical protein BIW11_02885 [Tropilaelaps mercedesae]|uniref:Uncharacterized protein n=1 Tax=Tropilaelaps mercedesae TaxID=418985 RepID=A0A1V9XW71_9ACAR|nr:hypothetical protein BIW11_02885 [Tropilaelaps mercedesae]
MLGVHDFTKSEPQENLSSAEKSPGAALCLPPSRYLNRRRMFVQTTELLSRLRDSLQISDFAVVRSVRVEASITQMLERKQKSFTDVLKQPSSPLAVVTAAGRPPLSRRIATLASTAIAATESRNLSGAASHRPPSRQLVSCCRRREIIVHDGNNTPRLTRTE